MIAVSPTTGSAPGIDRNGRIDQEAIPAGLRGVSRWLLWRYEERDGKQTKVPLDARTGRWVDVTDPASWSDFESAVAALEARKDCAGVGFVFVAEDDLVGVDLDDCIDAEGRLAPQAREIIDRLDTYTEISPSGLGVKLFLRGVKPEEAGCRTTKVEGFSRVEVYGQERFFTVTGQRLDGAPVTVEPRQEALEWLCEQVFPAPPAPPERPPLQRSPAWLDDETLIEMAGRARNGAKFLRLWAGDTSGHADDDSAADLALCDILAFWTGNDPDRIDRLLRQSGLYREKWEREDYARRTIMKAIEGSGATYSGGRSFARSAAVGAEVEPAALLQLPRTDVGNAERLVARFGGVVRYAHGLGWLVWDGARWAPDLTFRVQAMAQETVRLMLKEAESATDKDARDSHLAWMKASDNEPRIRHMLEMAKPLEDTALTADRLDADPMLLNCRNGTIDLRTGELREHRRTDLITRLAGAAFDPQAKAPLFDGLLRRIFRSIIDEHPDWLQWFQVIMGYCATGDVREQIMLIWHGDGANGKSVTAGAFSGALGDYAGLGAPDLLIASKHQRHPTELADLRGRRLVSCSESGEERQLDEAKVKFLTGERRIKGRGMRQDFFDFDATHKLLMMSNYRPRIQGNDLGIWRRIRLVPFIETIGADEKDPALPYKLEAEYEGILRFLVAGAVAWFAHGMGDHAVVAAATDEYREAEDIVGRFISDECEVGRDALVGATDLYLRFKSWCDRNGERAGTQKAFGKALGRRGFRNDEERLPNGRTAWSGLTLKADGGRQ